MNEGVVSLEKMTKLIECCSNDRTCIWVENIVGKRSPAFSPFPAMFSKAC